MANHLTPWKRQVVPDEILVKQKKYILTAVQPALHYIILFLSSRNWGYRPQNFLF